MGNCQSHQCNHGGQGALAEMPKDEKQLQDQLGNITNKLLVMSGKGGVGKSSVATIWPWGWLSGATEWGCWTPIFTDRTPCGCWGSRASSRWMRDSA